MIRTTKHLAYILKVKSSEIDYIINNTDKFYGEWSEIKKDKQGNPRKYKNGDIKKRTYNPSKNRLKVIQRRIYNNSLINIELPSYIFGAVKGKDNLKNARQHLGRKYKLVTDLTDYFPSITNKEVYNMFIRYNFSPDVSSVLTKLTTYKGKVPQGAPSSSIVSNLVFIKLGKLLNEFCNEHSIIFTSFVDDITFSSAVDFKEKVPDLLKIINTCFIISHNKTSYSRNPKVTGLHVMNNHIRLPEKFMEKLNSNDSLSIEQKKGLLRYKEKIVNSNYSKNNN